jgi:hypothetical protein
MKTTTEKKFDAVNYMREQRAELSDKLCKMTKRQIVEYFKEQKSKTAIRPSAK